MKRMNGNINLVSSIVRRIFSKLFVKPQAIAFTSIGAISIPSRDTIMRINNKVVNIVFKNFCVSVFSCLFRYLLNIGINAAENDPSPNNRLKRLDILKAV
jgi:hypothetical protein